MVRIKFYNFLFFTAF